MAALIRMELAENVEDLVKVVANLLVWLDRDQQAELRRAFKEWLGQILSRNEVPGIDMGAIHDLTEMHDMLNERIREWGRPYREEGLRLGREEGIELGEARLLKRQLTKRFGQLPRGQNNALRKPPLINWSCGLNRSWMPIRLRRCLRKPRPTARAAE
jgi:hypothetical protein